MYKVFALHTCSVKSYLSWYCKWVLNTWESAPPPPLCQTCKIICISCHLRSFTRLQYLLFQFTKSHLEVMWLKLTHGFFAQYENKTSPWTVPAFISYTCTCSVMLSSWANPAWHLYRIAGNFCEVQIFAIFATHNQNAKIRTAKYETAKFEHVNLWKFLPRAFCVLVSLDLTSDDGTIALFQTGRRRPTLSNGTYFVLR